MPRWLSIHGTPAMQTSASFLSRASKNQQCEKCSVAFPAKRACNAKASEVSFIHSTQAAQKKRPDRKIQALWRSRRLPILTSRFQLTIFGTSELNCCVRNGNRWNLTVIDTGQNTKCAFGVSRILLEGDIPSKLNNHCAAANGVPIEKMWSSPRSISTARLSASQHLHPLPINLVVFKGSYLIAQWDILSLGRLHA